eukprot:c28290_g1_i3 orf=162-494(-)
MIVLERQLTWLTSTSCEGYIAASAQRGGWNQNSMFDYLAPPQCGGHLLLHHHPDMTTNNNASAAAACCQSSPIIQEDFTTSMYTSPDAGRIHVSFCYFKECLALYGKPCT